ncbi:hypothetical protein HPB50_007990 [Hyalomma asiaticum]|uniref:Uncharacterized protein n=1 Tax=Hyalomma asiaticum TaxID=266040 RepID=A0ACB7RVY3_HYAAI|nr:hypothetical protein HPB50_007990 [Hyalomma asiaticum]
MPGPRRSSNLVGPATPSTPPARRDGVQETDLAGTLPATTTAATTVLSSPLDHILIFGHGRFQRHVLFCTALAFFTAITHVASLTSLARPVDHWCKPPTDYAYMTVDAWKNASVPLEADGKTRSPCLRYEPPLPYPTDTGFENRTMVPCDAGWDYDADTESDVVSIVVEWNLVCGRRWMLRVMSSVYALGGAVGAPLAGVAADAMGRRPVLCVWLFLVLLCGVSLAFAGTLLLFATLRALLSAAVASVLVTSLVVLFEVTDTQHRALFCSLAMASASFTAALYGEIFYYLELSWNACQVAFMVPTSVLVLAVYMMDESPCWLLAVSNTRRAEQVLTWAAHVNMVDLDVFKERLSGLKAELKKQQETQASLSASILSHDQGARATDLVVNRRLRKRTAVMVGCWFLVFAVFFNLRSIDAMHGNAVARAVLTSLKLTGILVDVHIITRAGRRRTLAFSMVALSAMSLALALVYLLQAPDELLIGVVVSSLLVFDMCVISMFLISAELYPTVVRAAGLAFGYGCGRLGTFVSPFITDIRQAELKGAAYGVAAALLLHFGVMALGLPETTQLQPANTMRDMAAARWALRSPLRLARGSLPLNAKRKRSRSLTRERSSRSQERSSRARDKANR